jgi:hypothetical protein
MMSTVVLILILTSVIILGAAVGRPLGWVAIGLCTIALLLALLGGGHVFR